jgi:hypothetical protein
MMKANGTTVGSSPSKSGVMMIDGHAVDSEQDHMIVDYNHMIVDYTHDDDDDDANPIHHHI